MIIITIGETATNDDGSSKYGELIYAWEALTGECGSGDTFKECKLDAALAIDGNSDREEEVVILSEAEFYRAYVAADNA